MVPKFALVVACIVFTLLPAYAQDDRKNEIGLLLGATVHPILPIPPLVEVRWRSVRASHSN